MFPEERPLVGAGPLRHRGHLFGRSMARRGVHAAQETVGVGEHQHAVVADVVAHEPVGDGSLRRNGLHRRMGAETAHHGVEARIGTAGETHPAVVVRHMFHEPLDRIVAVRRFVRLAVSRRADMDELALAHKAAPHILHDDDIAAVDITAHIAAPEAAGKLAGTVGGAAVGGTENKDGGFGIRFGRIDRGIEFHAVAHRDTVFGLVVERADRLGACGGGSQQSAPEQRQESAEIHGGLPGKGRGRREQSCEQECGK